MIKITHIRKYNRLPGRWRKYEKTLLDMGAVRLLETLLKMRYKVRNVKFRYEQL